MASSGGRLAATWESPTRSAVTIFRFPRELTPRVSCIDVQIVVRSFHESAACAAQLHVWPVAAHITAANSMRVFGCGW